MPPVPVSPENPSLPIAAEVFTNNVEDESPLVTDEKAYAEIKAEQKEDTFLEQAEDVPAGTASTSGVVTDTDADGQTPSVVVAKDEVMISLEKILEDGLGEYVAAMPEEARVRFLYKGQETAGQLSVMVHGLKIQAKKVIQLVRDWLLTIPGVNKYFLEQEAKIKTDQILELQRSCLEEKQNQP